MPAPANRRDRVSTAVERTTSAPARTEPTILDTIKRAQSQFEMALPGVITSERFLRQALTTMKTTPRLLECEEKSVLGSLMLAAQLGLEPGGPLGHAYLVPFRDNKSRTMKAQFILGYKGYIDLARRSGHIESIVARPVYRGEEFDADYGWNESLVHKPNFDGEQGELWLVYALAKYVGGGGNFVVLNMKHVEEARSRSKAGDRGPWVTDYEAMALKTAIRRLAKWLPLSVEVVVREATEKVRAQDQGLDVRLADFDAGDVIDLSDDDHDEVPTPPAEDEVQHPEEPAQ